VKPTILHSLNRDLVLGFLLCVVTLIAYHPAWNGKPIWDDDAHITKPELRSSSGLAKIWTQPGATQQYYPLVHSVFWLEYHLWGDSTLGYHLVTILLHFFSALLLVCILRRLAIPGAWFIAAIFALHPVHVESVAWISELKNTLSGVFYFATMLAYLKFDSERKRKYFIIAIGLFILGLLSKSVIATLPVSLLVVFWWKRGRLDWRHDSVPLLPFFTVGIASGLFTAWVEHTFIIGGEESTFAFTFVQRCLIAGRVVWFYLGKILWPVDLIFIYPRWNVSHAVWWQYLFPFATLLFAGVLWLLRKRWRAPLAAFLYFTVTIFPVLGFLNVYPFRFSFVADHFQYLACIGPIALSAAGIGSGFGLLQGSLRRFLKPMLYVIVLLTLSVLTWKQSGVYADAETLYRTTIRKNPDCWMAHNNLGLLLTETNRTDEAMTHFRKALEINPLYARAHNNLGNLLMQINRTEEAMTHFRKALEINPDYAETHTNLGILLVKTNRTEEAMTHFRKALEINPNDVKAHNNLGNILLQTNRTDEAVVHFRKALEINPTLAEDHSNLGTLLLQTGRTDEAVVHFRKALEINPNLAEAHNNLGNILLQTGRTDEAVVHFRKALEINPNLAEVYNNLGLALFQTGQTDEAISHYRKALEINADNIALLNNLAAAFLQKGQRTDAIQLLQRALTLAKSSGNETQAKALAGNLERAYNPTSGRRQMFPPKSTVKR
jgi:protein O-mannosyl-transferase